MIFTMGVGYIEGDPRRLLVGKDFNNNYCGLEGPKAEYPMLTYALNMKAITEDAGTFTETPVTEWLTKTVLADDFSKYFIGICVNLENFGAESCPTRQELIQWTAQCLRGSAPLNLSAMEEAASPSAENECRLFESDGYPGVMFPAYPSSVCDYDPGHCVPLPSDHLNMFNHYCVPTLLSLDGSEIVDGIWRYVPQEWVGNWWQYWAAMEVVWPLIPLMALVSFVAALLYILLIQIFAEIILLIATVTVFLCLVGGGTGLFIISGDKSIALVPSQRTVMYYSSFILWSIAAVYAIVAACLCRHFREASAVLRVASQFLAATPTVYVIPVVSWILNVAWFCAWIVGATFVLSIDSRSQQQIAGFFVFDFFMFLWITAFSIAASQMVVATAVVWWYFSKESSSGLKIDLKSPFKAMWIVFRYHQGSLAFGSFLLSLVRLVKWFLRWLKHQAQVTTAAPAKACSACLPCGLGVCCAGVSCVNSCFVWVIWSLTYLVECFERCVEFLNKVAYIQIALHGYNFCRAALSGFKLLASNAGKFALVACFSCVITWLGGLAIVAGTTTAGWFITVAIYGKRIASPIFPTIAYFGISLLISIVVLTVLRSSIDATLQSYLADRELHDGEPQYAPMLLKEWVAKTAKVQNKTVLGGGCCCCTVESADDYQPLKRAGGQCDKEAEVVV
eukprot:GHVQ01038512.1.p1 GENE.GHVQ01038512.1~~GHVQ01038512.1.p1  ORF type:complete len:677 (+),score=31.55 GHVQ01038512.1:2694-4724(+)